MKVILYLLALVASVCFFIYGVFKMGSDLSDDHEKKYTNMVGKRVLIDKDSVMIVDYSILHETYTLSNGKTVSINLIKK